MKGMPAAVPFCGMVRILVALPMFADLSLFSGLCLDSITELVTCSCSLLAFVCGATEVNDGSWINELPQSVVCYALCSMEFDECCLALPLQILKSKESVFDRIKQPDSIGERLGARCSVLNGG